MFTPNFASYDKLVLNTSAGKDSLAMIDAVYTVVSALGLTHKLVAVHCDLGQVEWEGTRELAQKQCDVYGIPLYIVKRPQGDLLHHVEHERKMWPGNSTRFCTSDHKRGQVEVLFTALVNAFIEEHMSHIAPRKRRKIRILNMLGLRAQESDKRKVMLPFEENARGSNKTVRTIDRWLPIHDWTEEQVWERIRSKGLPYHYAYDLGMPRLSCAFCIYAPPEALLLSGYHNRTLLREYVRIEKAIDHRFTSKIALVDIQTKLDAGYVPQGKIDGATWDQCA